MNYERELVGAGRFELPVSCSQSRRASHYATPRGAVRESRADFTYLLPTHYLRTLNSVGEASRMVEPQPSKFSGDLQGGSPKAQVLPKVPHRQ